MRVVLPSAFTALFLIASPLNAEPNGANKLGHVQQCQIITARLERLDCFDRLFPPQLPPRGKRSEVESPWQWEMAFDGGFSASDAEPSSVEKDKWVTLVAASESEEAAPVLIMSCINNISRVELTFPQALQDGRITVSVAGGPQQSWRSDDTGLLFSSAQGLPAISMMKAMAKQSRLVLRSNSTAADSLRFDGSTLNEDLVPLREECGW